MSRLEPVYPIRTERLTLRPYQAEDLEAALSYWSRADVTRYIPLGPYSRETFGPRLEQLMRRTSMTSAGDGLVLAVVPDGVDHVVGDMSLFWHSEEHQAGEIGFILHPDHQGHGYAREASVALLRMGFEQLGLHRIAARLDARNGASAAVLRSLGMRQEAHLVENEWIKGEWTDELVFALLRSEWLERQSAQPGSA
jgi:RimJ/RimL family protein N-acetyltransferase